MVSCHDNGHFVGPQQGQRQQQYQNHQQNSCYSSIQSKKIITKKKLKSFTFFTSIPYTTPLLVFFTTTITLLLFLPRSIHGNDKFNPYQLNGGLVSAIAGRDYVILASDTRLTDGGYEILTRRHLSSRLWSAADIVPHEDDDEEGKDEEEESGSVLLDHDGSILIPECASAIPSLPFVATDNNNDSVADTTRHLMKLSNVQKEGILVASAGCASDCEALKRIIRSEINARTHWSSSSFSLRVSNVATLLGQTLYSRRSFPFYSFCVLAGVTEKKEGGVYVYDAIGSFERVAVACAGVGKEMLQPILDRLFISTSFDQEQGSSEISNLASDIRRDGKALSPEQQRVGLLTLQPPVQTQVDCTSEEAVSLLVRAYRSVAEREIEVGDDVVVCIVKCLHGKGKEKKRGTVQVLRFPLKKH